MPVLQRGPAAPRPAQDGAAADISAALRNITVCYFLSGALGLIYQVLWLRKLLLVFGSTVHAVSTVLTVFFGGLALGSWLFGRLIDRGGRAGQGLRWYGLLEIGVGAYAFVTLGLFDALQRLYVPVYRASDFSQTVLVGGTFVCAALILIVPTTLLGGTFPVLTRFLIRSGRERGVKIASLYAVNTAGAMCGVLFVYYSGLPVLGLSRTLVCAGVLNIGLGLLCLVFDARLREAGYSSGDTLAGGESAETGKGVPGVATSERGSPVDAEDESALRWLLTAFAFSGAAAMICEVAWTRALSLVVGSSIYAFCVMLATYLGGIALGSALVRRRLAGRPAEVRHFIAWEWALAALGLLAVWTFSRLGDWFVTLWPVTGGSFTRVAVLQFVISALAMLPSTVALGILFPVVSDLVTRRFSHLGQRLGTAYAVNTLGGIIGSFLAGFVLIPVIGLPATMVLAALLNVIAAGLLFLRSGGWGTPWRRLAVNAAVLVLGLAAAEWLVLPGWHPSVFTAGPYLNPDGFRGRSLRESGGASRLLYYRDSLNATVSVHQDGELIYLKVGGKTDASTGLDMGTQVLSAHIPMLLHPKPEKVLVIGLGSGVTLGHAGRHPATTLHCAELDPAVIEGARFFKHVNYGIHDDPRVRMFAADGRNLLLASREQYDVLISEPSNPWMAGLAYLFTQEFYRLAKARLAPGGVMCQWLQLYNIFPQDVKLMMKTFHSVFPHVSVWSPIPGDLLLVGSMEPHTVPVEVLAERMNRPGVRESLDVVRVGRPELFAQMLMLGTREVEALTADTEAVHRDDQPSVEFNAPKALYASPSFAANYDGIGRFRASPGEVITGYDPAREDAAFFRELGLVWTSREDAARAAAAFERAVELDPGSADAWARLGELYAGTNRPLKAEHAFQRAIAADPAAPEAYRLTGRLLVQQGRPEAALDWHLQAASRQVPDGEFAAELGTLLQQLGQLPAAAEWYRSAMSQGGGERLRLLRAFAVVSRDLGRWDEAARAAERGVRLFPKEGVFPLVLGQVKMAQGDDAGAAQWLLQAVTVWPRSSEPYISLARLSQRRGEHEHAAVWLRRALEHAPYDREAAELLNGIGSAPPGAGHSER